MTEVSLKTVSLNILVHDVSDKSILCIYINIYIYINKYIYGNHGDNKLQFIIKIYIYLLSYMHII